MSRVRASLDEASKGSVDDDDRDNGTRSFSWGLLLLEGRVVAVWLGVAAAGVAFLLSLFVTGGAAVGAALLLAAEVPCCFLAAFSIFLANFLASPLLSSGTEAEASGSDIAVLSVGGFVAGVVLGEAGRRRLNRWEGTEGSTDCLSLRSRHGWCKVVLVPGSRSSSLCFVVVGALTFRANYRRAFKQCVRKSVNGCINMNTVQFRTQLDSPVDTSSQTRIDDNVHPAAGQTDIPPLFLSTETNKICEQRWHSLFVCLFVC